MTEKLFSQKNGYFWSLCSLEAKPLKLDKIGRHVGERPVKEQSNALFPSSVALLVLELGADL